MTENRRSKRAIRSHMAQTGHKYTEARRDLPGSGCANRISPRYDPLVAKIIVHGPDLARATARAKAA